MADCKELPTLSLHDALALGEVEVGLSDKREKKKESEEIERLPVLLRILSASRPLASIPTFDEGDKESESAATPLDEIANEVVARLEDVAATHSAAEGVYVVACHLAPAVCRNLSKLSPLKRKRNSAASSIVPASVGGPKNNTITRWDTNELVVVGSNPRSSFKRRRISSKIVAANRRDSDDIAAGLSEGVLSTDDEGKRTSAEGFHGRRLSRGISEAKKAGAEDSQEELVSKTLSELSALVTSALEPIKLDDERDGENRNGKLALASEDSTFSEPLRSHSDGNQRVMTGSDLGSTVAALMHHAPVLRHQHVGNALCRATVPQAAGLVKKMAANCPSSVPSLLRGCTDAYKVAVNSGSRQSSVLKMAKSAVGALAELSARENSRVRTSLQQYRIMPDVQLQLAMSQDPTTTICLLLEHLSSESPVGGEVPVSVGNDVSRDSASEDNNWKQPSSGTGDKMSLATMLKEKEELFAATLSFLRNELSTSVEGCDISGEGGRICILLRCYAWLVLHCKARLKSPKSPDGPLAILPFLSVLQSLLTKLQNTASGFMWIEEPLKLLLCGLILTLEALLACEEAQKSAVDQCGRCVKECLEGQSWNNNFGAFLARLASALHHNSAQSLRELFHGVLYLEGDLGCAYDNLLVCLPNFREWFQSTSGTEIKQPPVDGESSRSLAKIASLLDAMDCNDAVTTETAAKVRAGLVGLLAVPDNSQNLLEHTRAPQFIVRGTKYLANSCKINLPIVSPLELESGAGKLEIGMSSDSNSVFPLLLQILYWFAYLDSGSNMLHTFDVRMLPLKEIMSLSLLQSRNSTDCPSLGLQLFHLVAKHSPETSKELWLWELADELHGSLHRVGKVEVRSRLSKDLRAAISNNSFDHTGVEAEKSFLLARATLSNSDLFPLVASTLLSRPRAPAPFFTYSMLYSDPLVLLKAPMRVWQSQGLRRIVLSVLTPLLETHEAVLDQTSPSIFGANQLISARNLLLAHCILVAVSGSNDSKSEQAPFACSTTTSFLRLLIARNPGLVGIAAKQSPALPDTTVDWLVEFVPETMDDSESLLRVLSDRGSVTSRLTASASILRIAIAHGHRDEAVTERLVYGALSQLVSSFFLVIGPVGVPVNVLIGDGSGQDVTQISRKATFRMLRVLVNVRGRMRPRIRNECGLALHKLAGLCKGENLLSGVAGAVLSRRKGLLRDMFETLTKAANSMGSGMEL